MCLHLLKVHRKIYQSAKLKPQMAIPPLPSTSRLQPVPLPPIKLARRASSFFTILIGIHISRVDKL